MAALAFALGRHGLKLIRERAFEVEVRARIESALAARSEARLVDVTFAGRRGQPVATAVVRSPARFTSAEVGEIEKRLPRSPDGSRVRLTIRDVPLNVVSDDQDRQGTSAQP
jgi:hypothetical protein